MTEYTINEDDTGAFLVPDFKIEARPFPFKLAEHPERIYYLRPLSLMTATDAAKITELESRGALDEVCEIIGANTESRETLKSLPLVGLQAVIKRWRDAAQVSLGE